MGRRQTTTVQEPVEVEVDRNLPPSTIRVELLNHWYDDNGRFRYPGPNVFPYTIEDFLPPTAIILAKAEGVTLNRDRRDSAAQLSREDVADAKADGSVPTAKSVADAAVAASVQDPVVADAADGKKTGKGGEGPTL